MVGFAQLWWQGAGASGLACRWGRKELAILLPDTGEQGALETAELIRQSIEGHVFRSRDGRQVRVTISIGVAIYGRDATDLTSLQGQADQAAYLAKRMGKNRVCLFRDGTDAGS